MAKNLLHFKHRLPVRLIQKLLSHWLGLTLIIISFTLSYLNYQPGTWLTGWDNLHPEFNPVLDLKRNLFSVWQEYRGLGLTVGMAPAADLVRNLIMVMASFFIDSSAIRFSWTFLMLAIGPIGTYSLIHVLLSHRFDKLTVKIASFLGGLFYLLNLGTVQYFFTPFEPFHAFYGFLPWLLLSLVNYLFKPSRFNFFPFVLTSLLSAPSFYVQTLFIVISISFIPFLVEHFSQARFKFKSLLRIFTIPLTLIITQSYWLLPAIFFVLTGAGNVLNGHINLVSSPETYFRNLEFANLQAIALLKGYWFNYLDLASNDKYDYLMLVWRNHLNQPTIQLIGYSSFILVLTGLYYALKKRLPFSFSFTTNLIICYFFLLGGGLLINDKIPLIGELFRSPFTKFSILLSLIYSFFFSIGCIFLLDLFQFLHTRLTHYLTLFTVTVALIIFTTPAFTGNLISPNMRLNIPQEYFELFEFFKTQDPATRIANFPQHTFWGWNFYNWGYRGSGFLWYGLKQPILDRAFDVWEKGNEKYYEEISSALYSQDAKSFEKVVEKYAINWVIIDKNVISPGKDEVLYNKELQEILDSSDNFKQVKNFNDSILVYETNTKDKIKKFLSFSPKNDSSEYPFSNFNLRPITDWQIADSTLNIKASLNQDSDNSTIYLPSYSEIENYLPINISYRRSFTNLQLKIDSNLPTLSIGSNHHNQNIDPLYLNFTLPTEATGFILNLNDHYYEIQLPDEIIDQITYYPLTSLHLPTKETINIRLYASSPSIQQDLTNSFIQVEPTQCYTNKPNRKIEKIVNSNQVTLYGTDVVGCLSVPITINDPNQLISLGFTYLSLTNTPGSANLSDRNLEGTNPPQPLNASNKPLFTRLYTRPLQTSMQANLILEANESKSTQEITYQNIQLSYHDLLGASSFTLPQTKNLTIKLDKGPQNLSLNLPLIDSPYTTTATPLHNNLSPDRRNCDNFNSGTFDKTILDQLSEPLLKEINQTGSKQTGSTGFLYSSINANSCDQLNLRHLPHNTSYALLVDQQSLSGLPLTICLENHTTRRCDVFERLNSKATKQILLQSINNSKESPGYTLHLFNQSIGNRTTQNLLRSLTITPFPLNYLQKISISSTTSSSETNTPITNSTHPAEFLYTLSVPDDNQKIINLYQTYSPHWKLTKVPEKFSQSPLWQQIILLPYYYLQNSSSSVPTSWYNSWTIPNENSSFAIFYLPQYLEFLGFILLPIPILSLLLHRKPRAK